MTPVSLLMLLGLSTGNVPDGYHGHCRWPSQPAVLFDDGTEFHSVWNWEWTPELQGPGLAASDALSEFRAEIRRRVPDLRPEPLLLRQAQAFATSSDPRYRAEARNSLLVARQQVGQLRPIPCWQALFLSVQAERLPMVERPSEFGVYVLERRRRVRLYYSTQNRMGLRSSPAMSEVESRIKRDLDAGWRLNGHLHNHPFDFSNSIHFLGGPSPSISDVQVYRDRAIRWGMTKAWITNGFDSVELEAGEFSRLSPVPQ